MARARPTCDRCTTASITLLRYCGRRLCGRHFRDFVKRRVRKEVRAQGGIPTHVRIAVGLSGGKDSTVALTLLHDIVERRPDVELVALTVDEGIASYRPKGLAAATQTARALGIEHIVKRTQDLAGRTMDEIHALPGDRTACSYCGVFRRRLLNDAAREAGADLVVTGHNLDDVAQSVLMNLAAGEVARLGRLGPHTEVKPGLVPRRMPLRSIPELEVYLYAMERGLAWHDEECPYSAGAQRSLYRDILARMEDARPGTRHALVRTLDALKPVLETLPDALPLGTCGECGEPTSGSVCQACRFTTELVELDSRASA